MNPSIHNCDWYIDCLEKYRPCGASEAPYAVEYGNKFCNAYKLHYGQFSTEGQQWIDAVRKCLQVVIGIIAFLNMKSFSDIFFCFSWP